MRTFRWANTWKLSNSLVTREKHILKLWPRWSNRDPILYPHTHSHIPEMTKIQDWIYEITIFKIWATGSKRHNVCNVKQDLTARIVSKHGAGEDEQCSEGTELNEERSRKCWETCRGPSLQVRMAEPVCVGTPPEAWKDLLKRTRGHYRGSHGPVAGLLPPATLQNPISHRNWVECSKKSDLIHGNISLKIKAFFFSLIISESKN